MLLSPMFSGTESEFWQDVLLNTSTFYSQASSFKCGGTFSVGSFMLTLTETYSYYVSTKLRKKNWRGAAFTCVSGDRLVDSCIKAFNLYCQCTFIFSQQWHTWGKFATSVATSTSSTLRKRASTFHVNKSVLVCLCLSLYQQNTALDSLWIYSFSSIYHFFPIYTQHFFIFRQANGPDRPCARLICNIGFHSVSIPVC